MRSAISVVSRRWSYATAFIANRDWISPELNKDYAEWAEHNHTFILPTKVKKPKYKSSVENAVDILEKGFFHDIICSHRDPSSWSAMIMNDVVSANAILKQAKKHYTVMIKPKAIT